METSEKKLEKQFGLIAQGIVQGAVEVDTFALMSYDEASKQLTALCNGFSNLNYLASLQLSGGEIGHGEYMDRLSELKRVRNTLESRILMLKEMYVGGQQ